MFMKVRKRSSNNLYFHIVSSQTSWRQVLVQKCAEERQVKETKAKTYWLINPWLIVPQQNFLEQEVETVTRPCWYLTE